MRFFKTPTQDEEYKGSIPQTKLKMKPILFKVIMGISKLLYPSIERPEQYYKPLFKLIHHLLKNNGTLFTVKHLKQMRLHCTRFLCGQPLLVNDCFIGLDAGGWPSRLSFLKPLLSLPTGRSYLLTLLMISRTLRPKSTENIPYSTKSITDPYKGTGYEIPHNFTRKFVRDFGLSMVKPSFDIKDVYLSMKAGPNGPATLTVLTSIKFWTPAV